MPCVGYDRPLLFLLLALVVPTLLWVVAGALSRSPEQSAGLQFVTATLGVLGLLTPIGVAAALILPRDDLREDVRRRLLRAPVGGVRMVVAAAALMPGALLVATAVSVALGGSAEQFLPRGSASFTPGLLPAWFVVIGAAVLEELAWHSYGTDALVSRMRVLTATLVFSVYWALWHAPLAGIRGMYQAEVVEDGWVTTATFILSIPIFMVLMNWLYFRSGRCILVAVVFHVAANVGNEILRTESGTKLIQTLILALACILVLWHDRALFLGSPRAVVETARIPVVEESRVAA